MTLSIIVTTWRCEPWLADCRASIRAACAGFEGEIETIEVCNGNGAGAARNEGLVRSSGDYLWFVDGDDVVRVDSVRRILDAIRAHPGVDIVHFPLIVLDGGGAFPPDASGATPVDGFDLLRIPSRVRAYRRYARWLLASNTVLRRDFAKDMRFEPLVKGEDSLWGRRAFYRAASLVHIPNPLYGYRRRTDGADQTRDASHYADAKRAVWLMFVEGLRVRGIRLWVCIDWLRARFRDLPGWYGGGRGR